MLVQIKATCMVESKKFNISTAAYTWQVVFVLQKQR